VRYRRYLFIDFDGVLHPDDAHFAVADIKAPRSELLAAGLFTHVETLALLLEPHIDVGLVVHSSWRLTLRDSELHKLLGPLGTRFAGATDRGLERVASIAAYVRHHHLPSGSYRVLDDQPKQLLGLGESVISCNPRLGLGAQPVQALLLDWLAVGPAVVNDGRN
jgi:hypothetical protein